MQDLANEIEFEVLHQVWGQKVLPTWRKPSSLPEVLYGMVDVARCAFADQWPNNIVACNFLHVTGFLGLAKSTLPL